MSGTMLSHLKVVEIADSLGAYTGRILADLGARVIKVEPPHGDASRANGRPANADAGVAWQVWNAGKRGARLDLEAAEDVDALKRLLKEADILIQGGQDGLARRGIDYAILAEVNPALISVIVQPFAEIGTLAGAPASDLTLMAMSGIMQIVGDPDRPPLKLPGEQAYALAGTQGAIAALLALNGRATSGRGQRVVVSAYQSAVLAGYRDPIVWEWTGQIGRRTGNKLVRGKSGVRQVWLCKDGYVTWSLVDNPGMVKGLVSYMEAEGRAGAMAEVDWDTLLIADAPQNQIEAWEDLIGEFFAAHTRADLVRMSADKGMGLSQIDSPEDAIASPHWAARDFWRTIEDKARGSTLTAPGRLFQTTVDQGGPLGPAPSLHEPSAQGFDAS